MKSQFLGLLFLCCINLVHAQDSLEVKKESNWKNFTYDMGAVVGGMGYAYSRPFHWKKDNLVQLGALAAGTGLLYIYDEEVSNNLIKNKENVPSIVRDYGWYYGSPQNNYMITGAVYLTGLFTKNEKLRRTGVLLISSASAAGLLQQISKRAFGRARPRSERGKAVFEPGSGDKDYHSFPSGHAILAFTNAYAIAKQFKNPWVKSGIYALGLVPGVSRIWEGAHWLTDVAVSIAFSIATVEAIDRYLDRKYDEKYNAGTKLVQWNLNVGPGVVGIRGNF